MTSSLRPLHSLCSLDIETTCTDPTTARIVSVGLARTDGDDLTVASWLVNPGVPIPPEATAVHGITDEDVRDAPAFRDVAPEIAAFIGDSDLCGFCIRRFDLPVFARHMQEAGVPFSIEGRAVVDVRDIYVALHPRTLTSAVMEYLGREHSNAHSAASDAAACLEVLAAMLARHENLPRNPSDLAAAFSPRYADVSGRLLLSPDGEVVVNFGNRHRGRPLREVARTDPSYLEWVLASDFPPDTKAIVRKHLRAHRRPA